MDDDKTHGGETYFIVGCFDKTGYSGFQTVAETRPDSSLYCPGMTLSSGSACQDAWIGDGHCDDDNNNAACSYDGGDCCGDDVSMSYCSVCQCLDPGYQAPASSACQDAWIGDAQCDDDNNNAACSYDGGDCCGDNVGMTYCSICQCLDPGYYAVITNAPASSGCQYSWQGDGHCDDDNNNAECSYDGGDCCGDNVSTSYCSICQCLDPWYVGYETSDCGS